MKDEDLDKAFEIFLTTDNLEVSLAYYSIVMDSKIAVAKTKQMKHKYKRMKQFGLEYIANKKLGK